MSSFKEQLMNAGKEPPLARPLSVLPAPRRTATGTREPGSSVGDRVICMIGAMRKARGMSQFDLAAAVGVSRWTITNWETGKTEPSMTELWRVAQVLDVDPGKLGQWIREEGRKT